MNGCSDRADGLARHAAGELADAEAAALRDHLRGCTGCRAELEAARGLEDLLRAPSIEAPARGFTGRVMAAVDRYERERLASRLWEMERERRRPVVRGDLLPAALLTAAAVIAGLLLLPEISSLQRVLSEALTAVAWPRSVMGLLGARGGTFDATRLYPSIAVLSILLGLAEVSGLAERIDVRSLLPIPGDRPPRGGSRPFS